MGIQNASPFPVRKNTTSLTKSTSRPAKSGKMSFAVGGNAVGFDTFVSPGVGARAVEYGASSYPVLHPRQNSTTPSDTINMFIESMDGDWEYAASIVEACADQTILALRCTSGGDIVGSSTCGPNAVPATVTMGTATYHFSSAVTTSTMGSVVSATATCAPGKKAGTSLSAKTMMVWALAGVDTG